MTGAQATRATHKWSNSVALVVDDGEDVGTVVDVSVYTLAGEIGAAVVVDRLRDGRRGKHGTDTTGQNQAAAKVWVDVKVRTMAEAARAHAASWGVAPLCVAVASAGGVMATGRDGTAGDKTAACTRA